VLGDVIERLVETYSAVAADPDLILETLQQWPVNRETYYAVRSLKLDSVIARSAQFIYLNKTSWNGLYRVNSSGQFNVPYGQPKSDWVTSLEVLSSCSGAMKAAEIRLGDFEATVSSAGAGDLVYFDPPYVTGHNDNGFVHYNEALFTWADQKRLASVASDLVLRGANVMVSNADHPDIRSLYPEFRTVTIDRRSTIASKASARRAVTESLFLGGPAYE
jgi:DNA adenine methylase